MEGLGAGRTEAQVSRENEAPRGGYLWEASAVRLGPPPPFSWPLSSHLRGGGHFPRPWPQARVSPACVLVPGPSTSSPPTLSAGSQAPLLPGSRVQRAEPSPQHAPRPPRACSAVLWGLHGVHTALRLAWERRGRARGRRLRTWAPDRRRPRAGLRLGTKPARAGPRLPRGCPSANNDPFTSRLLPSQQLRPPQDKGRFILVGLDQQPRPPPGRPPGAEAGRPARHLLPMWPGHGHPRDPPPS